MRSRLFHGDAAGRHCRLREQTAVFVTQAPRPSALLGNTPGLSTMTSPKQIEMLLVNYDVDRSGMHSNRVVRFGEPQRRIGLPAFDILAELDNDILLLATRPDPFVNPTNTHFRLSSGQNEVAVNCAGRLTGLHP